MFNEHLVLTTHNETKELSAYYLSTGIVRSLCLVKAIDPPLGRTLPVQAVSPKILHLASPWYCIIELDWREGWSPCVFGVFPTPIPVWDTTLLVSAKVKCVHGLNRSSSCLLQLVPVNTNREQEEGHCPATLSILT